MMNCIIVDDDALVRMEVEQMVKKTSFLRLVATCPSAMEALNAISTHNPDLIFLDVMMPEMTGIELMKTLSKLMPQVILMTMNKEFAAEAFDYEVTDFLAKPITEARFRKAVLKAQHLQKKRTNDESPPESIFIKNGSKLTKVNVCDILYLESDKDYLHIQTTTQRHTLHNTLKSILDKLPARLFMRVHNSYAVRLDKITSVEESTLVIGGKFIPVSRTYKEEFLERLNLV